MEKCWWRLRMKGRILTIFLTFSVLLLFPSFAYSKVPLLYKWEDNDRISIRVITSQKVISKSTEGGETITQPAIGPFDKRRQTKKVLSSKGKHEKNMLRRLEVEINDSDGSFIKRVVLDKGEIDDFKYHGGMSPKENFLIYHTEKNEKWTLWADPLIKGTAPIPVFTQEQPIVSDLSPDETKFALIANKKEWGHSVLIVNLDDVSKPAKISEVEGVYYSSNRIYWSPTGTHLAYTSDRRAYLVSADGNQKVFLTDNISTNFMFEWGENRLYFISNSILMEMSLLNPDKPYMLVKLPEGESGSRAEFSPDKSKIAIVTGKRSERKDKHIIIVKLLWNYVYKNEPWKELFEYEWVIQKP